VGHRPTDRAGSRAGKLASASAVSRPGRVAGFGYGGATGALRIPAIPGLLLRLRRMKRAAAAFSRRHRPNGPGSGLFRLTRDRGARQPGTVARTARPVAARKPSTGGWRLRGRRRTGGAAPVGNEVRPRAADASRGKAQGRFFRGHDSRKESPLRCTSTAWLARPGRPRAAFESLGPEGSRGLKRRHGTRDGDVGKLFIAVWMAPTGVQVTGRLVLFFRAPP